MLIYAVYSNTQFNNIDFNKLMAFLTVKEQERINRFLRWQDAQSTLIGKVLIRAILYHQYQIENELIIFDTNIYGKPYLRNREDIQFNISHSGGWVVCAIDKQSIGIDIEQIKEVNMDIAKRFFSHDEYNVLMSKEKEHRIPYFYDLWTLKESYIKAEGRGLSIPLNSFGCIYKEGKWHIINGNAYHCEQYDLDCSYKLSICASNNNFPKSVRGMSIEEFLDYT